MATGCAAGADNVSRPSARQLNFADRILFKQRFILKFTVVADSELEPAGSAVVLIMVNGHAILKPQRTELGDVDVQAETPVVIKIS